MDSPLLYDQWAPADAIWSAWAKPVLFHPSLWESHIPTTNCTLPQVSCPWMPPSTDGWCMVVNMPGLESIAYGWLCAQAGFRPVPLFNGVPSLFNALINVSPLLAGLYFLGPQLEKLPLSNTAPPVFLIDSRRMEGNPTPNRFDNRWVVTPQDFPSANRLLHHGIDKLCYIGSTVPEDIAVVFKRWQESGIHLRSVTADGVSTPLAIPNPSIFRRLSERLSLLFSLRRSSAGGFGGLIPEPQKGGG
jgi:hypothetical protein